MTTTQGIDLKALAKIDAKIAKANERLASAARANRNLTRSMRELTIEDQIAELNRERGEICGGRMVIFARGEYRVIR
jgi:hypothetical protein